MNRAIKILLIVFLSLLILGLLITGAVFLGRSLGKGVGKIAGSDIDKVIEDMEEALPETDESFPGGLEPGDLAEDFGNSVAALDIRVSAGKYHLVAGDSFRVEGKNINKNSFSCTLEGDTLVVQEDWGGVSWSLLEALLRGSERYSPEVTVTIPADTPLREVELELRAGKMDVCDLAAGEISVDMSAGELTMGQLRADEAEIRLSAGALEIRGLNAPELELENSAGSIRIDGLQTESLEADCSAGSIQLALLEKEVNCRLEMEISAGSARVGGRDYHGDTMLGDKDAPCRVRLNVSAGSVRLDFQ